MRKNYLTQLFSMRAVKYAFLLLCAIVMMANPRPAAAQWVVSDPILEAAYALTVIPLLNQINANGSTAHADAHLQSTHIDDLMKGMTNANIAQTDRNSTLPLVEKINADAAISPTSGVACKVLGDNYANGAKNATSGLSNILTQQGNQANTGAAATTGPARATRAVCRRVGQQFSFASNDATGSNGKLGPNLISFCRNQK